MFNLDFEAEAVIVRPLYEITEGSIGQTVFNLPIEYKPGTMSLDVFKDGHLLVINEDYEETSPSRVTLLQPLLTGAKLIFRSGSSLSVREEIISTENQLLFNLVNPYIPDSNMLQVLRNGVLQIRNVDYQEISSVIVKYLTDLDSGEYITFLQSTAALRN